MMAFYDVYFAHKNFLKMTNEDILSVLQGLFPERKLFSISLDWRKDIKYFLKARGTLGDALVGWSDRNG